MQRLADPTHLGQSQFRKCYKANFSADMFCGSTREKIREVQKVFSQDMKAEDLWVRFQSDSARHLACG